jgi:hypothetical protein
MCTFDSSEIPPEDAMTIAVSEVLIEACVEVADLSGDIFTLLMEAPAAF